MNKQPEICTTDVRLLAGLEDRGNRISSLLSSLREAGSLKHNILLQKIELLVQKLKYLCIVSKFLRYPTPFMLVL
jgi:hypothetical protein